MSTSVFQSEKSPVRENLSRKSLVCEILGRSQSISSGNPGIRKFRSKCVAPGHVIEGPGVFSGSGPQKFRTACGVQTGRLPVRMRNTAIILEAANRNQQQQEVETDPRQRQKMPGVTSSRAWAPDGRKMLVVNGVTYEWQEGLVELEKAIESMYDEGVGPGCHQCEFRPCVLQYREGEALFEEVDEMKERGNPNPFARILLVKWWKEQMTTGFGRSSDLPLPCCVTRAIEEKYPNERLYDKCTCCQYAPCLLYSLEAQGLLDVGRQMFDADMRNDKTRFFLYRNFTRLIHDLFDRPPSQHLPQCVVDHVKKNFPNQENMPCIQFTEGCTIQFGVTIEDLALV